MSIQGWGLTAALMLTPVLSLAGGRAVILSGEAGAATESQIEFDGDRLRVQALGDEGTQGYLVIRDGRAYTLVDQDGSLMVIDMASMMKTMGGMMSQQGMRQPSLGAEGMTRFVSLADTGRSETVGGIGGRVHLLTYVDADGATQTETVVLSKDQGVRELTEAMLVMGKTMTALISAPANAASDQYAAQLEGQGLLRHGTSFKLVSLSGERPAAARFELPAEPMQMPNLGGLSGGAGENGIPAEGGASGLSLGNLFGNKAERQQQRLEGRTEAEVDEATDSAVDKALDKVFGKLFGE